MTFESEILRNVCVAFLCMVRTLGDRRRDTELELALSRYRSFPSPRISSDRWGRFGGRPASLRFWIATPTSCATCAGRPTLANRQPYGNGRHGGTGVYVGGDKVLLPPSVLGEDDVPVPGDHLYFHGATQSGSRR